MTKIWNGSKHFEPCCNGSNVMEIIVQLSVIFFVILSLGQEKRDLNFLRASVYITCDIYEHYLQILWSNFRFFCPRDGAFDHRVCPEGGSFAQKGCPR